jgi:two-component system CheB/CheR fusion protein
MKNLLNSTDIATLFLDKELNIRRFTDTITKLFKLRPTDIGRPFTDMVTDLQYPEIANHAQQVLRTLVFKETDISTNDQRWFTVRIMPYRTHDDHIDGLVLTFIDITKAKRTEAELATANKIERGKRASDLVIADQEVVFQHDEKEKLQAELNKAIKLLKKHNLYES